MKVKISYTVEHDEIPIEIAKFLEEARKTIHDVNRNLTVLASNLRSDFDYIKIEEYVEKVYDMRNSFVSADVFLSDSIDILTGLKQLVEESQKTESQEVQDETSELHAENDLGDYVLKNKEREEQLDDEE